MTVTACLDFHKVVAAAKCAELFSCRVKLTKDDRHAGRVVEPFPVLCFCMVFKAHGNTTPNAVQDGAYRAGVNGRRWQICLHRAHAAADVNANGIGHNGIFAGDHPAYGHAESFMAVRHKRDMAVDKGEFRKIDGLFERAGIDCGAPGFDEDPVSGNDGRHEEKIVLLLLRGIRKRHGLFLFRRKSSTLLKMH
jgi:hypothetical protein